MEKMSPLGGRRLLRVLPPARPNVAAASCRCPPPLLNVPKPPSTHRKFIFTHRKRFRTFRNRFPEHRNRFLDPRNRFWRSDNRFWRSKSLFGVPKSLSRAPKSISGTSKSVFDASDTFPAVRESISDVSLEGGRWRPSHIRRDPEPDDGCRRPIAVHECPVPGSRFR